MLQFFYVYFTVVAHIHEIYCSEITSKEYFTHKRIVDYNLTLEHSLMKYDAQEEQARNTRFRKKQVIAMNSWSSREILRNQHYNHNSSNK